MKPSKLSSILMSLLPLGEPVLIPGPPGVGKTSLVEAAVRSLGYDLLVMHPVVSDPTDFKGMPASFLKDGVQVAEFLPFGDLWRMINATRPLVVLMDDVGQAPLAVQAALMQLVLARKINGYAISDHVRFVAATNRRSDKAGVTGLITPLLDRFTTVIELEFDMNDWLGWAIANEQPTDLLAFARFRPDLFNTFEATMDMKKSATPRSIAGMGRILVRTGNDDLELLSGAVGDGFATEFLAFRRTYLGLPKLETLWADPMSVPVPTAPDVMFALMGALAHRSDLTNFAQTVRFLDRVPPEYAVVCIKDAVMRHSEFGGTPAFIDWAERNRAMFGYSK